MDKIKQIINYDYTSKGGYLTIKFDSGWVTRRKFINLKFDKPQRCSLSGKNCPENTLGIYFAIKKRGYSRYYISQEAITSSLNSPFIEDCDSDIEKSLRTYFNKLQDERNTLMKQDEDLREAIREIKFKNSKIGKRMSATVKLMELVTQD